VNFLYDNIVHVLQSVAPPNCTTQRSYSANTKKNINRKPSVKTLGVIRNSEFTFAKNVRNV